MSPRPNVHRGGLRVVPGGADAATGPLPADATPAPPTPPAPGAAPERPSPAPIAGGLSAVPTEAPAPVPAPEPGERWTAAQADAWLEARDLAGWRFSLDRIERLLGELGAPHRSAPAIHVVGTNGKSSTTRMVAALLQAHGRRPGAFLSPHLAHLRERIEIGGEPVDEAAHVVAVAAVARAAERVDAPGDPVTQFEAHTAAAFVAMAAAGADVLVVEAGLGGRLDATNVLDASVVALTSVDLDHTELLGETIEAITAEKVAVVTPGSTLVLGADLDVAATIVARDHAARVGATVVTARPEPLDRRLGAGFQARNYALARAVCEAYLGSLDLRIVREVAAAFTMPARFERLAERPVTILDGAHNPAGAAALAEAVREAGLVGPGVVVMSVFADKDVPGIAAALAPLGGRFVLTDCGAPRALAPEALARELAAAIPGARTEVVRAPLEAVAAARLAAGPEGFVVICGTLALAAAVRGLAAAEAR